ncbi:hypothetical protein BXZ70DRAFT_906118 [Cristinia sonorae]|uniref:Uncharacterized protein n=1 Tax=Cristinia sonorae TaxID=1940300 RepID=A0A8K0USC3_9AGAR|nr:hypothetical protein BXZ70DRAFT_906118 [Cristinia sonorae]
MTSPSLPPPPTPLNLQPEPVYGNRRPPSPLRNAVTLDPDTGAISEDGSSHTGESENGAHWGQRPESPSPSITQFAANIAQRMNSIMSNMSQRSPNYLPTDEELEAEAEREREKSRREAERILSEEAETRRLEERVLAMLETDMDPRSLPPPPSLGQNPPGTPPSPSNSQKAGWWNAAKNKLTPTKEPLTPAQQIIQDTKAREKEIEKEKKEIEKEMKEREKEMKKLAKKQDKQKGKEWPSSPEDKFQDPAFLKLGAPNTRPRQMSSPSPSPMRQSTYGSTPSLSASPLRLNKSQDGHESPSRQAPPIYAQFNTQGTLDVPGTLLMIAARFEKLERWTVGHVRALEERMDDVERWLVDKEGEKERDPSRPLESQQTGEPGSALAMQELREELAEVQGRIGELGREMAKMVVAPGNLSSGPSRNGASIGRAPSTSSSIAVRSISANVSTPRTTLVKDTTSPPVVTTPPPPSRTRLPYPTGDYATPPDSTMLSQGPFSPPNSPPPSLGLGNRPRTSISGLPSQGSTDTPSTGTSPSGLPSAFSPPAAEPSSPPSLPPPPSRSYRTASVSPTPRKRYTVALGGPIVAPERARERSHSRNQSRDFGAPISMSPASATFDEPSGSDSEDNSDTNQETIGKAAARTAGLNIPNKVKKEEDTFGYGSNPAPQKRARPQSMYSGATSQNILAPTPTAPLNTRLRSHSTDRFGLGFLDDTQSPTTPGKFVDPLQIRRQSKEAAAGAAPVPPKAMPGKPKVPVGQLVAFFDKS